MHHSHAYAPSYDTTAGYASVSSMRHPEDSDHEGGDSGPPKKKRRRQALSCTECKRRKIKCDRSGDSPISVFVILT
ncbi:hypothetical protein PsYK624_031160 [Phanerochaete sordida]|uniref:Zn(2)-C6 fungal-type domain-containing protein n=1 Tax=Phanerochaete sordida TaxID=48140 RepID=A0A9P3G116_9APHY|nr:hypothetical protein PsYK624_031160 [Phanerochaete sordida]